MILPVRDVSKRRSCHLPPPRDSGANALLLYRAASPRKSDSRGALSGTPRSSSALRQTERSQRRRWRSRIANIPNRRNELTDFHDIQATKASSLGLPGVTGDKFGGVTLSCSCNMQQIEGSASGGDGGARDHTNRIKEQATPIHLDLLEASLGKKIGLHFKT